MELHGGSLRWQPQSWALIDHVAFSRYQTLLWTVSIDVLLSSCYWVVCGCVLAWVCTRVQSQRLTPSVFFDCFHNFFVTRSLSGIWSSPIWWGWWTSWPQGSFCLSLLVLELLTCTSPPIFQYGCPGPPLIPSQQSDKVVVVGVSTSQ